MPPVFIVSVSNVSGETSTHLGKSPRCLETAQHHQSCNGRPQFSGGDIEEAIPDPIPNSEVKLLGADGTARATVWESRTLPG